MYIYCSSYSDSHHFILWQELVVVPDMKLLLEMDQQGCSSFIQSVLCGDGCLLEESLSQGWNHCEVQDREEAGRDRAAKASLERTKITESNFADDVALYAVNGQAVEKVAVTFVTIAAWWGLTVSFEKTKMMLIGCLEGSLPIQLKSGVIALWIISLSWK